MVANCCSGSGDPNDPKRSRACEACRGLKVRCDQDPNDPNAPCKRCAKAKRNCIITAPSRKRQKKTDSRVAELEKKIDALTASLNAQKEGGESTGGYGSDGGDASPDAYSPKTAHKTSPEAVRRASIAPKKDLERRASMAVPPSTQRNGGDNIAAGIKRRRSEIRSMMLPYFLLSSCLTAVGEPTPPHPRPASTGNSTDGDGPSGAAAVDGQIDEIIDKKLS
jgi:hypothetical protein